MEIVKIAFSWPEPAGFKVERPDGIPQYHFLHFWNPCELVLDGQKISAEPHACIIYKPHTPQYYSFKGKSMQDWFRIEGDLDAIMEKYGLSYNTVYYPQNYEFISSLTRKIEYELTVCDDFYDGMCESYLTQFFIMLSRGIHPKEENSSLNSETRTQLLRLRQQLHREHYKNWTIGEMANFVNLSPSYLHAAYKRFFGVSPLNDLILFRIDRARSMLSDTQKSVNEIATVLGYNNPSHFIRQFAKKVGVSPYKYRQQTKIENIRRGRYDEKH